MRPNRAFKRVRGEDISESFWDAGEDTGTYLTIKLRSGKPIKEKGWPWVQLCMRGILGGKEKVAKANFQNDGRLLVKTKDDTQAGKLLKAQMFGDEECEVERDQRLNQSKGTVHAYDLMDLSDEDIVGWFSEFGVVSAKRFTRKVENHTEKTPTILLTFDKPSCPSRLEFDYITYQVRQHIPNPLICHNCGKYGHIQDRCRTEGVCLTCGGNKHEGTCVKKCINCKQSDHACLARQCPVWKKEREICELKVTKDISYAHARREYEKEHQAPILRPYASVARAQSEIPNQEITLRNRVENMERKLDKMITLLDKLLQQQMNPPTETQVKVVESQDQDRERVEVHDSQPTVESREQEEVDVLESQIDVDTSPKTVISDTEQDMDDSSPSVIEGTPDDQTSSPQEDGPEAAQSTSKRGAADVRKNQQGGHNKKKTPDKCDANISPSPQIGLRRQSKPGKNQEKQMPSLTRMNQNPM